MKAVAALIEHDYYAWLFEQAALLRRNQPAFLDWANVAEELEGMGRSEAHEIESFIERLLVHLLKWAYAPRKRSGSWEASIENSRDRIERRLNQSPSLRPRLDEFLRDAYRRARRTAGAQMRMTRRRWEAVFPSECQWPIKQVLDVSFWPEVDGGNGRH